MFSGHNEAIHDVFITKYYSHNQIKDTEMGGALANMGERRVEYGVLVEKPEGNRPVRRLKRSWEDNIKMDLREVGWEGMDWIYLAQNRDRWRAFMNAVMNLRLGSIKCEKILE